MSDLLLFGVQLGGRWMRPMVLNLPIGIWCVLDFTNRLLCFIAYVGAGTVGASCW